MIGATPACWPTCTVPYEASRDVTIVWEETADCLGLAASMCRISQAYLGEMTFDLDALERSLDRSFTSTTEIADTLVRERGLPVPPRPPDRRRRRGRPVRPGPGGRGPDL